MRIYYSSKFEREYKKLPQHIKGLLPNAISTTNDEFRPKSLQNFLAYLSGKPQSLFSDFVSSRYSLKYSNEDRDRYESAFGNRPIKEPAEEKEKIFRENPFDGRLDTHKLSGRLKEFWAFSIDQKYRIIFEFTAKDAVWFHSTGDHSIYD